MKQAERKVRELEEDQVTGAAETLELVATEQEASYTKKMQRVAFLLNSRVAQTVQKKLYGLKLANVPSVNSLASIYMCLERPWCQTRCMFELMCVSPRLCFESRIFLPDLCTV